MDEYDRWRNAVAYALDLAATEFRRQDLTDEEYLRKASTTLAATKPGEMPPGPLCEIDPMVAAAYVYRRSWTADDEAFIAYARDAWQASESGLPVVRF